MNADELSSAYRRKWEIDPSTRIRPSKAPYNRGSEKRILSGAIDEATQEELEWEAEMAKQERESQAAMEELEILDAEREAAFEDGEDILDDYGCYSEGDDWNESELDTEKEDDCS